MKLATTTSDFSAYAPTPAAQLELCGNTPFRYIDLNLPHRYMTEEWEQAIHDAGETAARLGLTLVQAHAGDFLSGGDPTPKYTELTRALRACAKLGIPQVVVHAQWDFTVPYPAGMEQFFAYNKGLYEGLFPVMEETGVKVLIENSAEANMGPACYFMTGKEMVDFLDYVNHPPSWAPCGIRVTPTVGAIASTTTSSPCAVALTACISTTTTADATSIPPPSWARRTGTASFAASWTRTTRAASPLSATISPCEAAAGPIAATTTSPPRRGYRIPPWS